MYIVKQNRVEKTFVSVCLNEVFMESLNDLVWKRPLRSSPDVMELIQWIRAFFCVTNHCKNKNPHHYF